MSKPHRRATVTVASTTAQRGNGGIQQLGRDSTPNPEHRRRACPHGDPVSPRRGWRVAMGHDAVKACQECLTSCQASLTRDCAASSHPSHFCNTPPLPLLVRPLVVVAVHAHAHAHACSHAVECTLVAWVAWAAQRCDFGSARVSRLVVGWVLLRWRACRQPPVGTVPCQRFLRAVLPAHTSLLLHTHVRVTDGAL